ncbi:hypothetical protein RAS1_03070 [Phycisphaerae bacterium RAS1]|nr:hypothetical protein RAS1_03070 [Phycisphaerae bacterium RAS1]
MRSIPGSGAKPTTIDEYLAAVDDVQRPALERLRSTIRAAAPDAEECISYQLAAFRHAGRMLVAFGATDRHCAFYVMSDKTLPAFKKQLAGYDTSKGTIRFQPQKPLPAALVRKLVGARIAENAATGKRTPKSRRPQARKGAASKPAVLPSAGAQEDPAVSELLGRLEHAQKAELEALRRLILGVSPAIREGVKWNSPSFQTTDFFATINVHRKGGAGGIRLILHTGAKRKDAVMRGRVPDPAGLLTWLAEDRCLVAIADAADLERKRTALGDIVRRWIARL